MSSVGMDSKARSSFRVLGLRGHGTTVAAPNTRCLNLLSKSSQWIRTRQTHSMQPSTILTTGRLRDDTQPLQTPPKWMRVPGWAR